jgi:transcriptional regulator with XRE-family HTH domain
VTKKLPNPVDVEIGQRIRNRRNQVGMSQTELALGCGITFQQVQKYEKGTNRVSGSRMVEIAALLKVPVEALFGEGDQAAVLEFERIDLDIARQAARLPARQKHIILSIIGIIGDAAERTAAGNAAVAA